MVRSDIDIKGKLGEVYMGANWSTFTTFLKNFCSCSKIKVYDGGRGRANLTHREKRMN